MQITLVDIVRTWLDNNPKYKDHYVVVEKPSNNILSWIACRCTDPFIYPPALPPTPIYDFLIDDDNIEVYAMKTGKPASEIFDPSALIHAHDPEFFNKLEFYLDASH